MAAGEGSVMELGRMEQRIMTSDVCWIRLEPLPSYGQAGSIHGNGNTGQSIEIRNLQI